MLSYSTLVKQKYRTRTKYGCNVTVVPYNTTAEEIIKMSPDGVMLSNGPGDPEEIDVAVK